MCLRECIDVQACVYVCVGGAISLNQGNIIQSASSVIDHRETGGSYRREPGNMRKLYHELLLLMRVCCFGEIGRASCRERV